MTWSIVLIHKGNQNYLRYNLHLLSRLSPQCDIILAGDESNRQFAGQVERCKWISIEDLASEDLAYQSFVQSYQHFSVNPFGYERFCFERWFLLSNLAKANRLDNFVYLDTDNILLTSPGDFLKNYTNFDYGQTIKPSAPEFIFFQDIKVINAFCNYLLDLYSNSYEILKEVSLQNTHKIWNGTHPSGAHIHFSDMWAMLDFWENTQGSNAEIHKFETCRFRHVCIPEFMENNSINMHGFRRYKSNLYRFDGQDRSLSTLHEGQWLRINMMHFQGGAKEYIKDFYVKFLRALDEKSQFECKIKPSSKFEKGLEKLGRAIKRNLNSLNS
ncbi:MAG: hypothetical protein ACFBSF_10725 [Leptolyngbyaceae cyanobacterium]